MSIEAVKEATAKLNKAREELRAVAKSAREPIAKMFQEILERHTDVNCVTWTQYAPHFNDGDACIFHVHGFCILPANEEPRSNQPDYDFEGQPDGVSEEAYEELSSAFSNIDNEDLLKAVFGADAKIIITRDDCEVDYCDHD